ncbi:MAG: ribonuclease H-like domain-containing protein [Parcubacteria group bacterium]|nr:ribonuclease H-like domain-containing protein [Parcubacteria group bacterium]
MSKLIFDIETIGADFDAFDKSTQEVLTRWIKKEAYNEEEYETALADLKNGLGFSPLTGEIVAIGVLDYEKNQGTVYFQAPNQELVKELISNGKEGIAFKEKSAQSRTERSSGMGQTSGEEIKEFEEDGIKFKPVTEKEMLENFWRGIVQYQEFISFNGRGFDVPFLMARSALHKIRPSKDLMSNRYLSLQKFGASHVDLLDQLSFYGAVRKKGNLHLWSRFFGIKSPKTSGVTGDDIGRLFQEKKFLDIARYNVGDLRATKELYEYWNKYIRF